MSTPVTIVTGASKGIGLSLAQHYCDQGHIVVGCSRGDTSWISPNYHHVIADVSNETDVKSLFRTVRTEFGGLTNLINNAGIASMNHSLLTPVNTVENILATNVVGCFLFCREAAKIMRAKKYGRIVNFSTVAVRLKLEGEAIYVASKAAVEGLTDVLSREFAEFGITVNSIAPTPVKTDLIRAVPEAKIEALINRQSVRRFGTVEDIANVIDFYLRPESDMINGQHLYLGGV